MSCRTTVLRKFATKENVMFVQPKAGEHCTLSTHCQLQSPQYCLLPLNIMHYMSITCTLLCTHCYFQTHLFCYLQTHHYLPTHNTATSQHIHIATPNTSALLPPNTFTLLFYNTSTMLPPNTFTLLFSNTVIAYHNATCIPTHNIIKYLQHTSPQSLHGHFPSLTLLPGRIHLMPSHFNPQH